MTIFESNNPDHIRFIHDNLYLYNISCTGEENRNITMKNTEGKYAFVVHDDNSNVAGGLVYSLKDNNENLYIDLLWVSDALRGRGAGAALVNAAKTKAAELGCRKITLFTFAFQAPAFYEKLGFKLIAASQKNHAAAYDYEMILK